MNSKKSKNINNRKVKKKVKKGENQTNLKVEKQTI